MNATYKESYVVLGGNFNDAGKASLEIKKKLKNLDISEDVIRRAAIVSYEVEMNIISYARRGSILLTVQPGAVILEARDEGPGIENIALAMEEGYSTATEFIRELGFGAGMGLSNIKRCSDRLDITSEIAKGTCLHIVIETEG